MYEYDEANKVAHKKVIGAINIQDSNGDPASFKRKKHPLMMGL